MKSFAPACPALCWHAVTLADRDPYNAIISQTNLRGADRTFANLYIWNETYHHEISFTDTCVSVRFGQQGNYLYLPPAGTESTRSVTEALLKSKPNLRFVAATEEECMALLSAFPDTFTVEETRDYADYLYTAEALAGLTGKKLHAKRNHINAFTAAHSWQVHPLTSEDFDDCRRIQQAWNSAQESTAAEENRALERAFSAFSSLELYGAVLTVDQAAVAFTVGSLLNDTLDVHFEKAHPDFWGAYPVINREFVRMMREKHPHIALVNREDDMGLENLRRAKLSYRPAALLKKFTLTATPHWAK